MIVFILKFSILSSKSLHKKRDLLMRNIKVVTKICFKQNLDFNKGDSKTYIRFNM